MQLFSSTVELLKQLWNDENPFPFVREASNTCRTMENAGGSLSLQWVPPHCGVQGDERADALATAAHFDNVANVFIDRFTETRRWYRRYVLAIRTLVSLLELLPRLNQ